ncbi:TRAP transporter small permease [Hippea jasoniae]|uniref:TRAP transporter small permease n=1 Tax=Hippea jasoniae TaxID=944479 RepID=UPI0005536A74|nr:TRAP transporter small permease subunit [Hippea jasoniae]
MNRISRFFAGLSDGLNLVIELITALLLLVLSFFMITAVFFRYVLNSSIYFSAELSRFLLVYIAFLGSTVAYKHKAHVGVDLFISKLSEPLKLLFEKLIILGFFIFWGVVFVYSLKILPMMYFQRTATLNIPYAYVFYIMPITALVWFIHLVGDILKK